ncbi:MAG: lasso RiPP family leader peptide-containing protein [Spirochaetales bacterium]|nr:lasso RiPP family leader peptide-containing protein [Spirochaetales bacterium]
MKKSYVAPAMQEWGDVVKLTQWGVPEPTPSNPGRPTSFGSQKKPGRKFKLTNIGQGCNSDWTSS